LRNSANNFLFFAVKLNSFKRILLILITVFASVSLFSQTKLKDTVKINEVEVKAIKPKVEDKSLEPMQQITKIELDRNAGNTADGAVKTFSGVILKDYGGVGGIKTVMVRSLGANHTGVFVDGVQFSDVASGQVDLGKISTDNTDNVSLTIGQSTSLCQPARFYASANVISIQSAKPFFDSLKCHYKFAYKTGSFGMINPSFSLQNKIGKHSFSDISGNFVKANGEYKYKVQDTTLKRSNSDIQSLNLNVRLVSEFKDSSKLSMKLYFYNSERGLPGAVIMYNPFSSQRLWNNDFFSNLQYQTSPAKRLQWLSNFKYSNNYLRYLDPAYLNAEGKLDNRYRQHEYYVSQAASMRVFDSLHVSLASDFFINSLDANLPNYACPTRYSWLTALAMQYSFKRFEANGNLLGSVVREQTKIGSAAQARNVVKPSVMLGLKLTNKPFIKFRVMYKDVFRMPTFNDLYYSLVGNNNLKPEDAKQLNIGFTGFSHLGFIEYLSFKVDGFYNRVSDKIVAIPTKNLFVWSMTNIGKVDCRGTELQFQFQTKPLAKIRYSFLCNYSFQEAMDVTNPQSSTYNQQIPYIPFETFSTNISANFKQFTLTYSSLFNGFRYVLGENSYDNMLHGWWVSDLTALYDYKIKKNTLRLKAEVNNLFDKQYEVIKNFPMPGRSFFVTLSLMY
jgi:vitamin B12 transporter